MRATKSHSTIDDYYMPPLDMKNISDDGLENLARAVVVRTCKDYVENVRNLVRSFDNPLLRKWYETGLYHLEAWFKSETFKLYSLDSIDPVYLINTLKYHTPEQYLTEDEIKNGGFHLKELEDSMKNMPPFKVCDNMLVLRDLLRKRGIKWTDESIISRKYWVCITRVRLSRKSKIDVLNGYCTKGGYDRFDTTNKGLLEVDTHDKDNKCVEDTAHGVYNYILERREEDGRIDT